MKKVLIATALTAAMSTTVQADTLLGLYVGGQIWAVESSGSFGDTKNEANFNLADQEQGSFFAALEHPLPLVPNVKIARTTLDTDGSTELSESFSFDGEDYNVGDTLTTNFDISYMDYTLYYEIFDNDLISIDVGITGRDFDTDISISQDGIEGGSLRASGVIPMLYAYTNVGLPFTGFNVFGEANFLSIGDHSLYDFQVGVSYELIDNLAVDVNLTVGYRAFQLQVDDLDNLYSSLDYEGVFAGAIVHF